MESETRAKVFTSLIHSLHLAVIGKETFCEMFAATLETVVLPVVDHYVNVLGATIIEEQITSGAVSLSRSCHLCVFLTAFSWTSRLWIRLCMKMACLYQNGGAVIKTQTQRYRILDRKTRVRGNNLRSCVERSYGLEMVVVDMSELCEEDTTEDVK